MIQPSELQSNLRHIGTLPSKVSMRESCDATTVCPVYKQIDPLLERVPVPLTHGVIDSTFESVNKAVRLFDVEDVELAEACEVMVPELVAFLKHYGVESVYKNITEVEFNPNATVGFGYRKLYKNKRQMVENPQGLKEILDFTDTAHLMGATPMWSVSGKYEYLPKTKILNNDQRCFEIPSAPFSFLGFRLFQHFNFTMCRAKTPVLALGAVFQRGGFHRLISSITRDGKKGMGDVKKWDKRFMWRLRDCCRRVRLACYNAEKSGVSQKEYEDRVNYYYQQAIQTFMLTPAGQILLTLFGGMKSGDPTTSYDNTLAHLLIFMAYWHLKTGKTSWQEFEKDVGLSLFADDHLFSFIKDLDFLVPYSTRAEFYKQCGQVLKEEDDRTQDTWIGLTFLGATITKYAGMYAPKYDLGRLWSSIVHPLRSLSPTEHFMKLRTLLVMSCFNGEIEYNRIKKVVEDVVNLYKETYGYHWFVEDEAIQDTSYLKIPGTFEFIPDFVWSVGFWLGWETDGPKAEWDVAGDLFQILEEEETVTVGEVLNHYPYRKLNHCVPVTHSVDCKRKTPRVLWNQIGQRPNSTKNFYKLSDKLKKNLRKMAEIISLPPRTQTPKKNLKKYIKKESKKEVRALATNRPGLLSTKQIRAMSRLKAQQIAQAAAARQLMIAQPRLNPGPYLQEKMRKKLTGGTNRAMRDYEEVVMYMVAPKDGADTLRSMGKEIRWSSEFATMPTATAVPFTVQDAKWTGTGSPNPALAIPAQYMAGFLFRCAERGLIVFDANPGAATFTYQFYGVTDISNSALNPAVPQSSWSVGMTSEFSTGVIEIPLKLVYAKPTTTYAPHGPTWFAGGVSNYAQGRFFWFGGGSLSFTIAQTSATGNCNIIATEWSPSGGLQKSAIVSSTVTLPSGTATLSSFTPGYYSFALLATTNSVNNISISNVTYTCTQSVWCHQCIPGYDTVAPNIQGIRINSASLMYTNRAAPINKQGQVVGVQLPQEAHWFDYSNTGIFNALATSKMSVVKDSVNGMYGFMQVTKPQDLDIRTYTQIENNQIADSYYPIDFDTSFIAIGLQITTSAGQDGFWTASWGVEFQTLSIWYAVCAPTIPPRVFRAALERMKLMEQWYENDFHIAKILGFLQKIPRLITKYGPKAIEVARVIGGD